MTRVLICSDVHLCHFDWHGRSSEARMDNMIRQMNEYYEEKPYEAVVCLGDCSLDHWKWQVKGSWIEKGLSNTERFVKDYASRLKTPLYMIPGNHEQYGDALWQKFVGTPRQFSFTLGGYLFVMCDNYAGELDPDYHHDGVYTPTDLNFVRKALAEHPHLPVILCTHNVDRDEEPEEFYQFLKEETRITVVLCGHEHRPYTYEYGEAAGNICAWYNGHYADVAGKRDIREMMWGFGDMVLTEEGVELRYVEPENDIMLNGEPYHHSHREQNQRFFPRRDR